jgi:D-glycero-D-manno-heptose 1,7-bisphosphate phosphatase
VTDRQPPSYPLVAPGLWVERLAARRRAPAATLFLDRDGVVVVDTGYLDDPRAVRLRPGIAALIAAANRAATPVCVVTNQSGIDRGYFGWAEFAAVEATIRRRLARRGARLDGVAACPFHPDHTPGFGSPHDGWAKPGPRMFEALAAALNLDLGASWMIGDAVRDIAAAQAAGLAGAVLLGDRTDIPIGAAEFTVHGATSVAGAARLLPAALTGPARRRITGAPEGADMRGRT